MTLCTLSPYRGLGVAGRLLEAVVGRGVREVYAHVWEMNVEGIGWYARRGFEVEDVVAGYYRRLRPDGARVVRRRVGVGEWIGREGVVVEGEEGEVEEVVEDGVGREREEEEEKGELDGNGGVGGVQGEEGEEGEESGSKCKGGGNTGELVGQ